MPPTPAPPTQLKTGHFAMVTGLTSRCDLNHRAARVLSKSWTEAAQHPSRVPVAMVTGAEPKEAIWVKLDNIEGPILDVPAMTAPPYDAMAPEERTEVGLILTKKTAAPAPTMGIGEGTDDDPFAGLKQHMEADGFDTSNTQTFSLKPGSHGRGATLEECLHYGSIADARSQMQGRSRVVILRVCWAATFK